MSNLSVLLIDDNQTLVDGMETMIELHLEDLSVYTAYTGTEGLKLALAHHPQLIFLDLNLPDMRGEEILREVRSRRIPTRIILLTGSDDIAAVPGVNGYLKKPVKPGYLIETIRDMLGIE